MKTENYRECKLQGLFHITSLYTFSLRRFAPGYRFRGESHDFYEAVLVLGGRAGITADKSTCELHAGQMILHMPREFHNIWSVGEDAPEVLTFSFRCSGLAALPAPRIFRISPAATEKIRALYRALPSVFVQEGIHVRSLKEGKEGQAAVFLCHLTLFLLSVFAGGEEEREKDKADVRSENYRRILDVMEKQIDRSLSLSSLARYCHLSVPAVEKTVKTYSGFGAMAYFNVLKMRKAGELLSHGASVKETAYAVGFSDPNYFSARFRKWAGVSPTRYAKENAS